MDASTDPDDVVTDSPKGGQLNEADASIQQNACATLAAITRRLPEDTCALVELGAIRHISRAMQVHHSNVSVLRQASLAVRNMVARSVELRSRFLHDELEIEPLLRKAQQYQGCGDEAYAALRDLGCYIQLSSLGAVCHYIIGVCQCVHDQTAL